MNSPRICNATKVSADMQKICSIKNMNLAWDRLMRSGNFFYKWYWRGLAAPATLAQKSLFKRVRAELKRCYFDPTHVCVVSVPKKSGLLRHFAVLTIGDLLAYQAIVNHIADKTYVKIKARYFKSVFGNLYAGPSSPYLYLKWQKCYQRFNSASEKAFNSGYTWFAEYDFASFYDSICHKSLAHLLQEKYSIAEDVIECLCMLLERWTATDGRPAKIERRYLNHGIPQGPFPSALLAELVLSYIDDNMLKNKNIIYLRYADDIRIFAKDERSARAAAIFLDKLARNIGVFPQASKFDIRHIVSITDVLKRVPSLGVLPNGQSNLTVDTVNQALAELMKPEINVTLLKFFVNRSGPCEELSVKLAELIIDRPDLTELCCDYLERSMPLSMVASEVLIRALHHHSPYSWLLARVLRVLANNNVGLRKRQISHMKSWITNMLKTGPRWWDAVLAVELYLAAAKWKLVTPADIEHWILDQDTEWWSAAHFLLNVDTMWFGSSALSGLCDRCVNIGIREIERVAAFRLAQIRSVRPNTAVHDDVDAIFSAAGLLKKPTARYARAHELLKSLLVGMKILSSSDKIAAVDWKRLMCNEYPILEEYCVRFLGHYGLNRNMFVMEMDALLERVVLAIQNIKLYSIPKNRNPRPYLIRYSMQFKADYPDFASFCVDINDLRGRCEQTHAVNTKSAAKPQRTGRVFFSEVQAIMAGMPIALKNLAQHFPG